MSLALQLLTFHGFQFDGDNKLGPVANNVYVTAIDASVLGSNGQQNHFLLDPWGNHP